MACRTANIIGLGLVVAGIVGLAACAMMTGQFSRRGMAGIIWAVSCAGGSFMAFVMGLLLRLLSEGLRLLAMNARFNADTADILRRILDLERWAGRNG